MSLKREKHKHIDSRYLVFGFESEVQVIAVGRCEHQPKAPGSMRRQDRRSVRPHFWTSLFFLFHLDLKSVALFTFKIARHQGPKSRKGCLSITVGRVIDCIISESVTTIDLLTPSYRSTCVPLADRPKQPCRRRRLSAMAPYHLSSFPNRMNWDRNHLRRGHKAVSRSLLKATRHPGTVLAA